MGQLKAFFKWIQSFFRSQWEITDYPVRFREQKEAGDPGAQWSAQIINWWSMTGLGETKEEAHKNLENNLHQ